MVLVLSLLNAQQPTNTPPSGPRKGGTTLADQKRIGPKPDWTPYELKLGFNGIRSGRTVFGSGLATHEIQVGLAMHRAIAILDFGIEENRRGESFNYVNTGQYFRFGGDWNFVKDKESGNVLSLGLRYARAGFKDDLTFSRDQGFGVEDFEYKNSNLSARWFEVTLNLRGKIISNLYMGFTMRWQTSRKVNGEGTLKTFDIPGFGKTRRENSTAFDYYIMWRIPFKAND